MLPRFPLQLNMGNGTWRPVSNGYQSGTPDGVRTGTATLIPIWPGSAWISNFLAAAPLFVWRVSGCLQGCRGESRLRRLQHRYHWLVSLGLGVKWDD